MRYLGILALTVSLGSPALARKHQRRPAHPKTASVKTHRVEVARAEPAAEPPARPEPPPAPPPSAAVQADDDEVPGKKQKK